MALSPEKFNQLRTNVVNQQAQTGMPVALPPVQPSIEPSREQRQKIAEGMTMQSIKDQSKGLLDDFSKRANSIADVFRQGQNMGKLYSPDEALVAGTKIAKEATGGIADIFERGFGVVTDIIANDPDVQDFANTKPTTTVLDTVKGAGEQAAIIAKPIAEPTIKALHAWAEEHPQAASLIGSLAETGVNLSMVTGVGELGPAAKVLNTSLKDALIDATRVVRGRNAPSVISYVKDGEKVFTRLTNDELNLLKNEVKNIPEAAEGAPQIHLDPLKDQTVTGGKEISRSEFIKGHPQAAEVFAKTVPVVEETAAKSSKGIVQTVKDKVSDAITTIEPGVESTLNPSKLIPKEKLKDIPIEKIVAQSENKTVKLDRYAKQAEQAVSDYSKPTPLAMAGDKAGEALNVLNNKLSKQGQLKKEALDIVGNKKVEGVTKIRDEFSKKLSEGVGVRLSNADEIAIDIADGNKPGLSNVAGRKSKIAFDPADNKLILDTDKVLRDLGNSPTVQELDDTVDALQDLLYKRKSAVAVPVNGQVEGLLKDITGQLNTAVKKVAGEQYRKANSKFAFFIDVRDKLNKSLGAEGVRGASLMKQLFSPSGEAPRRLFAQIKDLTGIDLVEEATIAKFVMENIGDARQASLLEEVIKSGSVTPKSFIGRATDKLFNSLKDPIGKAKRVIKE